MLKITTENHAPEFLTVSLCGRFTGEYVPEVQKALSASAQKLTLNLAHVTFVDRAAMMFLCSAKSAQIAIENTPSYVALWMEQEHCGSSACSEN